MLKLKDVNFDEEFAQWEQLRQQLTELFKDKSASKNELMSSGIGLFECILVKVEGTAFLKEEMAQCTVAPLNVMERYEFVISNSGNYAAFRQLDELIKETKKIIARKRIMERA